MGTRVYIGGLDCDTRDRDVEKFFREFGKIREIILKRGFGFVEFADHRDADDAVHELKGARLNGQRVTVELARSIARGGSRYAANDRSDSRYGSSTRTEHRVIVQNLSSRVSWQNLKDHMRQAGDVTFGDAHQQYRNEGVVDFATRADMKRAIRELENSELKGRRLRLSEDKARKSQSRSRSRSDSSSRSRSKSRSSSRSTSRSRSRSRSRSASKCPTTKVHVKLPKNDECDSRSKKSSCSKSRSRSRSVSKSPTKKANVKLPNNDESDSYKVLQQE